LPDNRQLAADEGRKPEKASKAKSANKKVKVKPCGFLKKSPPCATLRVVFFQKTLTFLFTFLG
jgi:hypothetical protein